MTIQPFSTPVHRISLIYLPQTPPFPSYQELFSILPPHNSAPFSMKTVIDEQINDIARLTLANHNQKNQEEICKKATESAFQQLQSLDMLLNPSPPPIPALLANHLLEALLQVPISQSTPANNTSKELPIKVKRDRIQNINPEENKNNDIDYLRKQNECIRKAIQSCLTQIESLQRKIQETNLNNSEKYLTLNRKLTFTKNRHLPIQLNPNEPNQKMWSTNNKALDRHHYLLTRTIRMAERQTKSRQTGKKLFYRKHDCNFSTSS